MARLQQYIVELRCRGLFRRRLETTIAEALPNRNNEALNEKY